MYVQRRCVTLVCMLALALGLVLQAGTSYAATTTAPAAQQSCDSSSNGVYLYEDLNYEGRCVRLTDDVSDLASINFDNVVSSIRIRGDWVATLYEDPSYAGSQSVFTDSDGDLRNNSIGLNRASSVRVYRVDLPRENRCEGDGVYLYEDLDYKGFCVKLTDDRSDLDDFDFDNRASSVRIVGDYQATLYADEDYEGDSSTFTQSDSDLRDNGVGLNRTSSLRVDSRIPSANRCTDQEGVYLYADTNYGGRCIWLTGDVTDLRTLSFDDTISSLRVRGNWTVTLFGDLDFTGPSSTFTGDDSNVGNDGIGDNRATSVRVQRSGSAPAPAPTPGPAPGGSACDGSEGIYLYQDPQFAGRCIRFTSDAPDLRTVGFDDAASSVRVVGGWSVTLFRDLSGTGIASSFSADDADLSNDAVGDNQATSLRTERLAGVPTANQCTGAEGVYLYEHPQFGGRCLRLIGDAPDLRILGFDDTASSVRVVGRWNVTLYRDLIGTGISTTLTGDDADLGNDGIGDNQVTSVSVQAGRR